MEQTHPDTRQALIHRARAGSRLRVSRVVSDPIVVTLALLVSHLSSAVPALGAQHPLVSIPLADPVYVQLRGLTQSGCRAARVSPYRPYSAGAIRSALRAAEGHPACSGSVMTALRARFLGSTEPLAADSTARDSVLRGFSLGLLASVRGTGLSGGEFRPLWRDVRSTSEGDPPAVGTMYGRATWSGGPPVVAVIEGYAQSHRRNDPRVRAGGLRSTSGVVDFREAYITGQLGALMVSVGRGAEAWLASGDESLAIASHAPPLDRILLTAKVKGFEGRAFIATIDDETMTAEDDGLPAGAAPIRFRRLLLGHALTFATRSGFEATLGETAVISRGSSTFDLAFMNPLMLYVVTQNDEANEEDAQDNLALFGAVRVPVGRASFDAELFVDDFQLDEGDREIFPHQLAWRAAATFGVAASIPASATVDYRRVDGFTYLRSAYPAVLQSYDEPIGSELGPDSDMFRVGGEAWVSGRSRVHASIGYWRRGAQRIDERPGVGASGHANDPYPTVTPERPEVQRGPIVVAGTDWLGSALRGAVRIEAARLENTNNLASPTRTLARFVIDVSYAFRYP